MIPPVKPEGMRIRVAVPDWSLAEVVTAWMTMRGMDLISATGFLAEIGDDAMDRGEPDLQTMCAPCCL